MPDPQPFKVARDGTVTHREAGHIIGRVRHLSTGWTGYGIGDVEITTPHWNGRKYAARAVWNAYLAQTGPTRGVSGPGPTG